MRKLVFLFSLLLSVLVLKAANVKFSASAPNAVVMGEQAQVCASIATLVEAVVAAARPGDHILCMSNGAFGGVHARLLAALAQRGR